MAAPLTVQQILEVRARIRAIAERDIARLGPDALSMRSIAAELGWTAASLYRYYGSKAELIEAVRIAANERFASAIEAAYQSTDDLWDRSRAIGDAFVQFAEDEPAAYRLINSVPQEQLGAKSEALTKAEARSARAMLSYVKEMVDAGMLEGDPELIAHAYWVAMHGLISLRMSGMLDRSPSFNTIRHAIIRLITRGARGGDFKDGLS
ncbi:MULTISPECIES: TetR/AcrR family transcriptional regulator [Citromicrobium]|uniref:TetR/AcrR family transcriptional regulator n=1 Tax=Citromicrobium TaxID=72173 RepID=UPI0001DD056D|nr:MULTISPECIES: TetR/AcrR family transcriptional regulator [Citromicrobium]ALG60490.1 hypothetical protein WG74_06270 [Citromicrobium sp. JL477]